MPRDPRAESESSGKKAKEERLEVRLDPELAELARKKAASRGWSLGSVVRALLGLWVEEDVISAEDVGRETERAPKRKGKGGDKKK